VTSTVTELTTTFLRSESYESLAATIDVIAVALLVVLLVEQELIRAHGGSSARTRIRPFAIVIGPLLVAFVVILVARAMCFR
jgi:hypothetical protein